ncbi:menaquinone-specific isochorismate synthase [Pseudoglutamicibacter albus]|uniref:Menaquinone-specific isochorismate synthase n=1 Tax=Pseudoglutamicibacter albus TaxID=98671 RepID=A0ABU1Z0M5_9MICC|nr:chorismate-binding protein [Pseudoglutamicibacter albus]MDR7294152.1 menaquinone-specific isochorismate synthase [Pseudoglutamicibacter albus]
MTTSVNTDEPAFSLPSLPHLRVITRARGTHPAMAAPATLADVAGPWDHVWARGETSMVGAGEVLRLQARGDGRIGALASAWRALSSAATVDDAVAASGTGLAAFSSVAFSRASGRDSVLIVPRVVWGRNGDLAWITVILDPEEADALGPDPSRDDLEAYAAQVRRETASAAASDARASDGVVLAGSAGARIVDDAHTSEARFQDGVREAIQRIRSGELAKAVLSRDVTVDVPGGVQVVPTLQALAARYTDCWVYSVDGIIGATPEMLIEAHEGIARARVLAGTLDRANHGEDGAFQLANDQKQIEEHQYAIDSLVEELEPFVTELHSPAAPFVLTLPNVWHLASDVRARIGASETGPYSVLDLLRAVHPTAAVCGTPRLHAGRIIREIERLDRGAYAGPVGWVDARGNGEFGIALRCGVLEGYGPTEPTAAHVGQGTFPTEVTLTRPGDGDTGEPVPERIRLWAGCGIVADSEPAAELQETWAKMRPMLQALGVAAPARN